MKVLAIKQPWATMIAEGKKTIEVRSRNTSFRGRVAIYASRSVWNIETFPDIHKQYDKSDFATGAIIATAQLWGSYKFVDREQFEAYNESHRILDAFPTLDIEDCTYAWCLCDVKKLDTPIPYKMPKGCVVWANYEGEL